jgi:tRNA-modifying protein YgfZ
LIDPIAPVPEESAPADLLGREAVLDYGDGAAEYQALRHSAGVVVRADLTQIRMWGRDPVRMLNGLITNDLAALSADRAVYAAMLTPKGRMISDLRVVRTSADELIVDLPAASAPAVMAHLKKFVPPMFARSEDAGSVWTVLGVYGPISGNIVSRVLGSESVENSEDEVTRGTFQGEPVIGIGSAVAGKPGVDLFVSSTKAESLRQELLTAGESLGVRAVGFTAFEITRIEAGRPRYGIDINEETLPGEAYQTTGLMPRAISFSKGCYTGQEVVVRIAHRGHVNRHLRGLRFGDARPPAARTPLFSAEGKEIGWTTSAGFSPGLGAAIGLGIVRREIEAGSTVRLGAADGVPVEVVDLPFRADQLALKS